MPFSFLVNFFFPRRCLICQKAGLYLCDNCASNLPSAPSPEFNFIYPAFDYHDQQVRRLIWFLKYRKLHNLSVELGTLLYDFALEKLADISSWQRKEQLFLVIPVPLSAKRFRERGFNQAELLAKNFCLQTPQNFILKTNLVKKIKDTPAQASLRRRDRLKNLHGVFELSSQAPKIISKKNIILIDDVTTTGATLKELHQIFKKAGARQVIAFTLAHG